VALAHTGFKTLVEDGTERILGAHLLGIDAEEVVNIFALALRTGLSARDLKKRWSSPIRPARMTSAT
jgi:glutathione reductase (NADPH)